MRKIFCKILKAVRLLIHRIFEWCFSLHKYVTESDTLKDGRDYLLKLYEWYIRNHDKLELTLNLGEIREFDIIMNYIIKHILNKKEV